MDIPLRRKVGKLSGGQQAQVALTIALARRPELLVLDEPLAPLDPLARHEFLAAVMETAAEDGTSVLFSSHVVTELERVADYLVVLARGRVQVAGDVEDLVRSHQLLTGPAEGARPSATGSTWCTRSRDWPRRTCSSAGEPRPPGVARRRTAGRPIR